jgi:4'-phosphopantetheinyl transferase
MEAPPLDSIQVHVWTASLQIATDAISHLCAELAPDERARADRFRTPQLRRRFVVARVILRRILAAYAPLDASALRIGYGAHGKPCLMDAPDLRFNVSHAGDSAVYAVASRREVGIDIEATGREVDVVGVARQAFSSLEREVLVALAPHAQREAFFRIWTRKEAYIKARGEGLSYPTRLFSVLHCSGDDALIDDERDGQARDRWRVSDLNAPPGFAAALAAEGRDWTILRVDATPLPR